MNKHWQSLPKGTVMSPSSEVYSKYTGYGHGQPVLGDPIWAVGLDKVTSRGLFQQQPICDLGQFLL